MPSTSRPLPPPLHANDSRAAAARRHRLRIAAAVNLVLAVLTYVLAEVVAERTWLTTLFAYAPPLFLAAPFALSFLVVFLLALRARDRAASLLSFFGALLLLPLLLSMSFGRKKALPPGSAQMRVLTYNIAHGVAGTDKIAAVIQNANADVVCLQEVNGFQHWPDPLPALQKALPGYRIERYFETAIATKHPIRKTRVHRMISGKANRAALEAVVEINGRSVTFFSVHLATAATPQNIRERPGSLPAYLRNTTRIRADQIEVLRAATDAVSGSFVVCGDFNTPPRGRIYRRLRSRYTDSYSATATGVGWTYSTAHPLLRIDYVWAGGGVVPLTTRPLPAAAASDHLPVLAELAVP